MTEKNPTLNQKQAAEESTATDTLKNPEQTNTPLVTEDHLKQETLSEKLNQDPTDQDNQAPDTEASVKPLEEINTVTPAEAANPTLPHDEDSATEPELQEEDVFHSFTQAGFNAKLLLSIRNAGWERPSEIQSKCLPHTLKGEDLVGYAQTGSGKTGVFLLTVGHRLTTGAEPVHQKNTPPTPRAVILTPTRELAVQISEEAERLLGALSIRSTAVFGGASMEQQISDLGKGAQLVVGTPGRLKDLYKRKEIDFSQVELFICDEADRMFDMGFIDDVKFFLDKTPENTQRLMFSATANPKIAALIKEHLKKPIQISLHLENSLPESLTQIAYICSIENKFLVLLSMLQKHNPNSALIFTNTKVVASWLQYKLNGNDMSTEVLTGDLAQSKRIKLINRIKNGEVKFLIATDVASRGIHIDGLTHVYNFDVPEDPAAYVHRIGRTGRAEAAGTSYTLVCDEYGHGYDAIRSILGDDLATPTWPDWDLSTTIDKSDNPYLNPESNLYKDTVPQTFKKEERTIENRTRQGATQDSPRPDKMPQNKERDHRQSQHNNTDLRTTADNKTHSAARTNTDRLSTESKQSSTSILKVVKYFFSLLNPFRSAQKTEVNSKNSKTNKNSKPTQAAAKTNRTGPKRERQRPRDDNQKASRNRHPEQTEGEKRHHPGGGHRRPNHRNSLPHNHENGPRHKNQSTTGGYQPRRDPRGSSRPMPKKRPSKS